MIEFKKDGSKNVNKYNADKYLKQVFKTRSIKMSEEISKEVTKQEGLDKASQTIRVNDCTDSASKIDVTDDVDVKVDSFSWGRNSNLIVFCTELKSKNKFSFSVWNTNGYSCRSREYNFKELKDNYSDEKSYLTLRLARTKKGYLDCRNAKATKDTTL